MTDFNFFKDEIIKKTNQIDNLLALEEFRLAVFGKSGPLQMQLAKIVNMPTESKKQFGQAVNSVKQDLQQAFDIKKQQLSKIAMQHRLQNEWQDVSLAKETTIGKIHPLTQVQDEMLEIFANFGFVVKEGPSIENEWYNFTALNIDENHPARQMHDSFYMKTETLDVEYLLRTHTSPVQIRTMQGNKPPFKFVAPGRVYRCDWDATHTPMFHQIEGVVIDKNIHMGHLKYLINEFIRCFFEHEQLESRFRACFFPFTEPSAEIDIKCNRQADELILGEGNDWLEVMGCGMIHPKVLENVGIDASEYQGFAFGLGVERFAMLKYGIVDLREFFAGDLRWLNHYGFSPYSSPSILKGLSK